MEANNVVNLKVFLRDEKETEARRFSVDSSVVTSFLFMREKLQTVFPSLRDTDFRITWQDRDGDHITISTDEDFITAFTEMTANVKVLYITVIQRSSGHHNLFMGEAVGPATLQFPRIVCDACNQIITGYRYKCVQCPDYDLCNECEFQGNHSEHIMIRMPNNETYLPKCARKFMHHLSRGFKKHSHAANKEAYRAAKYASKFCGNAAAAAAAAAFGAQPPTGNSNEQQPQANQNTTDAPSGDCPFAQATFEDNPIHTLLEMNGFNKENLKLVDEFIAAMVAPRTEEAQSSNNNNNNNTPSNNPAGILVDSIRNVVDSFLSNIPKAPQTAEKTAEPQQAKAGNSGVSTPKSDKESFVSMDVDENNAVPSSVSKEAETDNNKSTTGWTFVATNNAAKDDSKAATENGAEKPPTAPTLVYHENSKVAEGLVKLYEMGFSNDNNILIRMLERYNGDVENVIRALMDFKL